jgi:hypothetical protein
MITLLDHIAPAHIPMHVPRTRVGKISEHRMLGIGPKPATNEQMKTVTQRKEIKAGMSPVALKRFTTTSATKETVRAGIVVNSNPLDAQADKYKFGS